MDPKDFGISTLPLNHVPYGPILTEALVGANAGKVAVVTGAARGIGQAIAVALARSGAKLALLDLSVEALQKTKAACQVTEDARVEAFNCNVTDVEGFRRTLKDIAGTLGPIDVLVNNAGIFHDNMMSQETFELFWKAVEVNFKGPMVAMYELLPLMRQRRSGCIINIASRSATVDMLAGLSYNSSKAALARATSTLQAELDEEGYGQDIQTYSLHPGAVWSDLCTGEFSFAAIKEQPRRLSSIANIWCPRKFHARGASQTPGHLQDHSGAVCQYCHLYGSRAG